MPSLSHKGFIHDLIFITQKMKSILSDIQCSLLIKSKGDHIIVSDKLGVKKAKGEGTP